MELSYIEKHVATKQLNYKGGLGAVVYFSTVIRHEPVTIVYDIVGHSILNFICGQIMTPEDIEFIEDIIGHLVKKKKII